MALFTHPEQQYKSLLCPNAASLHVRPCSSASTSWCISAENSVSEYNQLVHACACRKAQRQMCDG